MRWSPTLGYSDIGVPITLGILDLLDNLFFSDSDCPSVSYTNILPSVVPAQLDVRIAIFGSGFVNISLESQVAYLASNCSGYDLCLFAFVQYVHVFSAAVRPSLSHIRVLWRINPVRN